MDIQQDNGLSALLVSPEEERVCTGFNFTEGPVWIASDNCLVFSDIHSNRTHRWRPGSETAEVFREPSNHGNGNTLDLDGNVLTCEHAGRRVAKTAYGGGTETLIDSFEGKQPAQPERHRRRQLGRDLVHGPRLRLQPPPGRGPRAGLPGCLPHRGGRIGQRRRGPAGQAERAYLLPRRVAALHRGLERGAQDLALRGQRRRQPRRSHALRGHGARRAHRRAGRDEGGHGRAALEHGRRRRLGAHPRGRAARRLRDRRARRQPRLRRPGPLDALPDGEHLDLPGGDGGHGASGCTPGNGDRRGAPTPTCPGGSSAGPHRHPGRDALRAARPTHPPSDFFMWGLRPHAPARIGSTTAAIEGGPAPSPLRERAGVRGWTLSARETAQLPAEVTPSGSPSRSSQTRAICRPRSPVAS